jgi:hypothetical protein
MKRPSPLLRLCAAAEALRAALDDQTIEEGQEADKALFVLNHLDDVIAERPALTIEECTAKIRLLVLRIEADDEEPQIIVALRETIATVEDLFDDERIDRASLERPKGGGGG